jgi:hypothetical protein
MMGTRHLGAITLGRVPPGGGGNAGDAGVQFRYASQIPDRSALKQIDPSACYRVIYFPVANKNYPKGFLSMRFFDYDRKDKGKPEDTHTTSGLPGNPDNNELNVDGVLFQFNDAGEIFDSLGQRVGVLVCYSSNECQKYHY